MAQNADSYYYEVYIFTLKNDNYTNLDDIELEESGPYVYEVTRINKLQSLCINFTENEELLTYRENKAYRFLAEESKQSAQQLNENEIIKIINFPILVLYNAF